MKPEGNAKLRERYGKSENGNFAVIDTVGVPHPYVIGAKHVAHAADHFGGMLGVPAIESAEKNGIHCAMPGCQLSYAEHEKALLVECKVPYATGTPDDADRKVNPELHEYLMKVKPLCDVDGYKGFAMLPSDDEDNTGNSFAADVTKH